MLEVKRQSQITYLETNKTCWKLAESDEAKKGIKAGFHVWDFKNWKGSG